MAKNNDLMAALGKSFDKKNSAPEKVSAPSSPAKAAGMGKADKAKKVLSTQKSMTFYPQDMDAIKAIKDAIYDLTGKMPNDSLAVRIALRSCSKDKKQLVKVYEEIKGQDSRYKK